MNTPRKKKLRIKAAALKQAQDLANTYSIQYAPDKDTFQIYHRDANDNRGHSDLMVDADRWLPTWSRKKRLTTKYFQKLAEDKQFVAKQNTDHKKDALITLLQKQNKRLLDDAALRNKSISTDLMGNGPSLRKKKSFNSKSNTHTNTKKRKSNNTYDLSDIEGSMGKWSSIASPTKPTNNSIKLGNNSMKFNWNIDLLNGDLIKDDTFNSIDLYSNPIAYKVSNLATHAKNNAVAKPLLIQDAEMIDFKKDTDGKYTLNTQEFSMLDPLNSSLNVKYIPKFKTVAEAKKEYQRIKTKHKFSPSELIFKMGNKYYNLNSSQKVVELDPVLVKIKSNTSTPVIEKLMLNRYIVLDNTFWKNYK